MKRGGLPFEIAPRSIVMLLAIGAGVWLAVQLWVVWLILVMALIVAGTIHPPVKWLEARGFSRVWALVSLFATLTVLAALLVFLTVPPLVAEATAMLDDAPAFRLRLIAFLSERHLTMPFADMVQRAKVGESFSAIGYYLMGNSTRAAKLLGYSATTIVLSFYLVADAEAAQGVLYSLVPREHHPRLARILTNLETIVGGYMRGQFITCAAIGVFALLLLLVLGVPNALVLALFASVVDVLPFVGGLLVIIPAVLSALPLGVPVAAIVLVAFLVYMEFESRVLVPRVYGRVLRLRPSVVILALVAGGTLMGIIGALLALPIAAGLLMILRELHLELPGDEQSVSGPAGSSKSAASRTTSRGS
jgi:predicted PurR-regulated permease PerM